MRIAVFAGPTLPVEAVRAAFACEVLPPARQGDLYRAWRRFRPDVIGLIDGVFREAPAVWHREILWVLSQGVHVFGAASMGALRAAELDLYGMRGVGRVYEAYRAGVWPGFDERFEDDDEVAVVHAPGEMGALPMSDAMVDLRDTLLAAEGAGAITRGDRDRLTARMKHLHFAARSFEMLDRAAADEIGPEAARWLKANRIYRKRLDALAMLEAIAALTAAWPGPFVPAFRMERTLDWEKFETRLTRAEAEPGPDVALVLDELRLDPDAWRACLRAVAGQSASVADNQDLDLADELDRFRRSHGLFRRADLESWLRANALDEAGLIRLLQAEARLSASAMLDPPAQEMADYLRLSGRFAPLRERALRKRRDAASGPPRGPAIDLALDWYFSIRLGRDRPAKLDHFIRSLGWRDMNHFERAVWLDYRDAMASSADARAAGGTR
jgi:hypothetical protein